MKMLVHPVSAAVRSPVRPRIVRLALLAAFLVLPALVFLMILGNGPFLPPAGLGSAWPMAAVPSSHVALAASPVHISIMQIIDHPALDAARQGFLDGLAAQGYKPGKNLQVEWYSAQGDMSTARTIAQKFVQENVDLVLAIATPTAQAMANATRKIPILITAVTDPVAAGLVKSLSHPGTNVTGTTDMNPVKEQLALVKRFLPRARTVAVLYNAGEINSVVQVKLARQAAKELGLQLLEATASNSSEVLSAAQSVVGRCDAVYIPTDNTFVSAFDAVANVTLKNRIPVIGGEESIVNRGGLATIGINYYQLGWQTAEMAVRVLKGAKPATMPVESQKRFDLVINLKAAEQLGISVPAAVLKEAQRVIR